MDDRETALVRREIVAAYLYVSEHRHEVLDVVASVDGDDGAARAALQRAFGFTEVQAVAVLDLQMRRLTPWAVNQMRSELAEVDDWLADNG
jgi:DNA gyrase/topoisomerase IV subunit A